MFLGREGFYWWIGIVEENVDPLLMGRVKVRIFGYHSSYAERAKGIPTEDLPWATILVAPNAQNTYARIALGEWVMGFFMDGADAQEPVVMGIIPTHLPEGEVTAAQSFGKYGTSKRTFFHVTDSTQPFPPNGAADADYNRIAQRVAIASEAGHTIELLDYADQNKIRIEQAAGESYIEVVKGEIVVNSKTYGTYNLMDQLDWITNGYTDPNGGKIGRRPPPPPPAPPRRRRKIICTKLYELGVLPEHIYIADQEFGEKLEQERPDVYYGYIAWAQTVVDWMEGNGPQCMFWIRDEEKRKQAQMYLSRKWAEEIATPWAQHMAYLMGIEKEKNRTGEVLMMLGAPICKVIGVAQRWFGKSDKPDGLLKGFALWGVFAVLRFIVWLYRNKK